MDFSRFEIQATSPSPFFLLFKLEELLFIEALATGLFFGGCIDFLFPPPKDLSRWPKILALFLFLSRPDSVLGPSFFFALHRAA